MNFLSKPVEPETEAIRVPELTEADTAKVTEVIKAMSKAEKIVAVRNMPTEILQNEISRRIKRDKEKLRGFKELVESMEEY